MKKLSIAERRKYILDMLEKDGFVRVADIADDLNITRATVRKDMRFLESKELLYRAHGSASPVGPHVADVNVHLKSTMNAEIKRRIGIRANDLISEDDSIIIASGSTVYAFAEVIDPVGHLNVVTPSLKVSILLSEKSNVTVLQLGGVLHGNSLSVRGEYAAEGFQNLICSKLFFGVDGIDPELGVTCATAEEATLTRKMMKTASKIIVLSDSSKVGRKGFGKICNIEDIDVLITDSNISSQVKSSLEAAGVEVMVV